MDIEAIEKDAVVLTRYQIYLTQAHDGILLTLYGDDRAGMHERLQPSSCTRTGQRKSQINCSMLSSGHKRAD